MFQPKLTININLMGNHLEPPFDRKNDSLNK